MKPQKEVHEFFKQRPISTDGAINQHNVTVEDMEDGDIWCRVAIPVWPNNSSVVHGVVRLLSETMKWCPDASILARNGHIEVHIYEHACDPD